VATARTIRRVEMARLLGVRKQRAYQQAMVRLEGIGSPSSPTFHPLVALLSTADLVMTGCRVGRPDATEPAMSRFEGFAERADSAWPRALLHRSRALLADGRTADRFFEIAVELHAHGERSFDEARTRLLYGEYLRRSRRRTDAHATPYGHRDLRATRRFTLGGAGPDGAPRKPGRPPGSGSRAL
jgi:hypothetical protein